MKKNNLVKKTFKTLIILNAKSIMDFNTLFSMGYYSSMHDDHPLFYYIIKIKASEEQSKRLKSMWNKYKKEEYIRLILKNRHLFNFEFSYYKNGNISQSFSGTYEEVLDFIENIISPPEFITLIKISKQI